MPRGVERASVAAMAGSPPNRFNFVYATAKAKETNREREKERETYGGIVQRERGSLACTR